MQKHRAVTVERLEKFIDAGQFADVNLLSALWTLSEAAQVKLRVKSVPDLRRIPFSEAIAALDSSEFKDAKVGDAFGPAWATHWFHVLITIPPNLAADGRVVTLVFDPSCEALIWSPAGVPLQGITGGDGRERNVNHTLDASQDTVELFIEVACNGLFGNGDGIRAPDPKKEFVLKTAEVRACNVEAHALLHDFEVLLGIVQEMPQDSQLAADALYTANAIVNRFRSGAYQGAANAAGKDGAAGASAGGSIDDDVAACRKIARKFFDERRGSPDIHDHRITALGNCHIDTAWLWPYAETKRKCARSFATQLGLIDIYPHYKFTASQAQQFSWVEKDYPELFERMRRKAKEGQFIPVGGTWVEMDCNVPSGESFCRQFLHGQRYFESRFGQRCKVFWLPDTFGYSSQLPQIVKESDLKYFFTQKLSWNLINKFPHTTFLWTGLDGTSILTHFSPADTYCAQANVRDVVFSVKNNKDKEYTRESLLLYGNGDGGGGPLKPMIERLQRLESVRGLPARVAFDGPNEFFEALERTSRDLVSWKGELYFELHRGTYTSHGQIKRYNRKLEYLLRDIEILSIMAPSAPTSTFRETLEGLWKSVLLNQFHDVLPGSSIELVNIDAREIYAHVEATGVGLRDGLLRDVAIMRYDEGLSSPAIAVVNTTSWTRPAEVVEVDFSSIEDLVSGTTTTRASFSQMARDGQVGLVCVPEIGPMAQRNCALNRSTGGSFAPVTVVEALGGGAFVMENGFLRCVLDANGRLTSLVHKATGRDAIAKNALGNSFKIFEDVPLFWDAWDVEVYHLEKCWDATVGSARIDESGPLRVVVGVSHPITPTSEVRQRIILTVASDRLEFETVVQWNENRKMLKVEFPLGVNCDHATYETQFGYIQRPTHYNNSWDLARFEVCGHKFADLSEYGFGVALFNDCKYGHSVKSNVMRLSLLRAPKAPDVNCDIGTHVIRFAIYPHKGTFHESDVVRKAYQYNVPALITPVKVDTATFPQATPSLFSLDVSNVVIDTVKLAEDQRSVAGSTTTTRDIVVRLYEAYGGRGTLKLATSLDVIDAKFCNILEDMGETVARDPADGSFAVEFSPFKIISIRMLIK